VLFGIEATADMVEHRHQKRGFFLHRQTNARESYSLEV
jgi:hypothetical protein